MAESNNSGIKIDWTKIALYAGGGLIVYYGVLEPILVKLGIIKGAAEKKNDAQEVDLGSAWNPNLWKQAPVGALLLTTDWAKKASSNFYNEVFGLLSDDYDFVLGIIKQLRTKSQVSFLADVFQQTYGKDLYSFLRSGGGLAPWDGLSEAHMNQLNIYVNNLPNYK